MTRMDWPKYFAVLVTALVGGCGGLPEGERSLEVAGRCEVRPPFNPNFEPELEWAWAGSAVMPTHHQVMMTPVVADLNQDGTPDVIFNTFAGSNYTTNGVLRAISGDDGHELWTVTAPAYRVRGAASIAAGDIDGDGLIEVCTIPEGGTGIICFENTGAFKFRTSVSTNNWGGPAFADLDGDGQVEIINGNHVFNADGTLRWSGAYGANGPVGSLAFAADIDLDGRLEVVDGRVVYRSDGSLKCTNSGIGTGLAGVANFDHDPYGEIVVVWFGRVSLLDDNCALLWTSAIPGGGNGGAPNIADFDNDGQPEIGVAGASQYVVFETNGAFKWSRFVQDRSSNVTGSSTFDFEGDGRAEVVYADELRLRVYDGATGNVRFDVPRPSGTAYENPLIVDVDGDNNAEIVTSANNYAFAGPTGILVYRDRQDGWVNTRRIWNQHAYSVTNVNEDGTIPLKALPNWLTPGLNTFRSNSQGAGQTSPFAAPDLVAADVRAHCLPGTTTLELSARVINQGDAAASAGLSVAFYGGSPGTAGSLLGVATLSERLGAGEEATVVLSLDSPDTGSAEVWAVADDDGTGAGREIECNEANNASSASVNLSCLTNLPPVAVCRDVTVSAGSSCSASASVDHGSYDPDQRPGPFTITESPAGPFGLGHHPVTLIANDGAATASCVGTVTVVDDTPPTITCSAPLVLECNAGEAVATFTPTASDNCGPAPTSCSHVSGSTFPMGRTQVTCNASDASGNGAACGFTVTVQDTQPPTPGASRKLVLWSPNHNHHSFSLSNCAADPVDACGGTLPLNQYGRITRITSDEMEMGTGVGDGHTYGDILITGPSSFELRAEREGTADGRVYTVHYMVTDAAGNSASATCMVTVLHDQSGRPASNSGPAYCVGEGCPDGLSARSARR